MTSVQDIEGKAVPDEAQLAEAKERSERRFILLNYLVIALLNLPLFCLTSYGNWRLNNITNLEFTNWDALKLCLAVAVLNWVILAYGLVREYDPRWVNFFISRFKSWDRTFFHGLIWILNIAAAATQTAFVTEVIYCKLDCEMLNEGSVHRNVAYTVLTWLLSAAWTPMFVWSLWWSRTAREPF